MVTVVFVENPSFDLQDPKPSPLQSPGQPAHAAHAPESAVEIRTMTHASETTEAVAEAPGASDVAERYRRITATAYDKSAQRGFEPGHMWEDWQAAEREVDAAREPPGS